MNILITGGAGFIGSHLCENLIKNNNNQIFCLDNFNNSYNPNIKKNNIKNIIHNKQFTLFKNDITNKNKLETIFENYSFDIIVHLAALAGVRPSINNPEMYTITNIIGTQNLLECSKKYNVKHFILASSSSIYGQNEKIPFEENDPVDTPISPYAASKKSCELICHTYHHLYNINIIALRYFTVYGPRQRPDLAIHKFTKIIYEDGHIPMFGNGSSKRDYTYINDIINGTTKSINYIIKQNKPIYEIINLGESNTVKLKYLITLIENAMNKKATIKQLPTQPGDVPLTYASINKAKLILGYDPKTPIEKGITLFVNWFLNNTSKQS